MWRELFANVPNRITFARLVSIPLLWVISFTRPYPWLGVGLAIAAATDVADGVVARRTGTITPFGSRLDSIADHILTGSTVVWLIWLRPDFFAQEATLLLTWVALGSVTLLIGWIRFGRVGGVHLYSAKAAAFAGYVMAVRLLLFPEYERWLFLLALALATIAALETLAVFLTRDRLHGDMVSIFARGQRGESVGSPR